MQPDTTSSNSVRIRPQIATKAFNVFVSSNSPSMIEPFKEALEAAIAQMVKDEDIFTTAQAENIYLRGVEDGRASAPDKPTPDQEAVDA